jgi:uncharacterized RDD family membrane protein YckC
MAGITTALNVAIDVKPAAVFARIGAFIIDAIVVVILYFGVVLLFVNVEAFLGRLPSEISIAVMVVLLVGPMVYPLVSEAIMNGQTLGKVAVGIRVVRMDGRQLRLLDVAARWLLLLVEGFATGGSLAIASILFTKHSQRIGDVIAGTLVVKVPQRVSLDMVLALTSAPDGERRLVFPSVSRLSDAEVSTIRRVVEEASRTTIRVDVRVAALWTLRDAVARKLGVQPDMGAEEFLRTVLEDYAVLRG